MSCYNCQICNFSTNLRSNYVRHLLTPKHKKRIDESLSSRSDSEKKEYSALLLAHKCTQIDQNVHTNAHFPLSTKKKRVQNLGGDYHHICSFCNRSFSKKSSLTRHHKYYCKEKLKEEQDDELKTMMEMTIIQQSRDIQELLKKVPNIEDLPNYQNTKEPFINQNSNNSHNVFNNNSQNNSNNNSNNTINHTTINNINNTININNFGNENLDMLTNKFMRAMIDKPYTAIPKMIKKIHFNDKYPENKNIRMLNKKDNKLQIIENGKWIYVDKDETLDMLLGDKNCKLDDYYERNKSKFTDTQVHRFNHFQEKIGESDKKVNQNIVKGTDLIFWNNM